MPNKTVVVLGEVHTQPTHRIMVRDEIDANDNLSILFLEHGNTVCAGTTLNDKIASLSGMEQGAIESQLAAFFNEDPGNASPSLLTLTAKAIVKNITVIAADLTKAEMSRGIEDLRANTRYGGETITITLGLAVSSELKGVRDTHATNIIAAAVNNMPSGKVATVLWGVDHLNDYTASRAVDCQPGTDNGRQFTQELQDFDTNLLEMLRGALLGIADVCSVS